MTNLEAEIRSGIDYLANFDPDKTKRFLSNIETPVLVGAMGSSYYLPAGRANSIIEKNETRSKLKFIFASEAYAEKERDFKSLVLISNSGQTREIINLAQQFPKDKVYAVTSNEKSELAACANKVYRLMSGKEKAVAATKSIIEQSILCENLVRQIEEKPLLNGTQLREVASAMNNNFTCEIDSKLLILISGARTVYFAGGSCGIGEEVSLKFTELAKKKAKFIPGTQILHGPEEVIEKGDVVFLFFANKYKKYFDRFKQMKEKTGCYFVSVGEKCNFADFEVDIELLCGFKPYCILAYFWNILTRFALAKGYSLDKGEKISKVGVSV